MNGILLVDKPAGWTSHDVVAKLRGILSAGMILCAEDEAGNLRLLAPEGDIADGSGIF